METRTVPLRHPWPHRLMPPARGPIPRRPHHRRTAALLGVAVGLTVLFAVATWRWRSPPSVPAAAPHLTPPAAAVTAQMDHDGTPHAPVSALAVEAPPRPALP